MVASRGAASPAHCIRAGAWRARHEQEEKGPSFVGEVLMVRRKTRRRQCQSGDQRVGAGDMGQSVAQERTQPRAHIILITTNNYLAYCDTRYAPAAHYSGKVAIKRAAAIAVDFHVSVTGSRWRI